MSNPPPLPAKCSGVRIYEDTEVARGEFRERRLDEPLADYNNKYPAAASAAAAVIDALSSVIEVPANKDLIAGFVGNKEQYAALRSLAAPPISADDLATLLKSKINKTTLRKDQGLADNLANLFKGCLDPYRFPWVAENRAATSNELKQAKLATAVLTAVSAVQAGRRGDERKALEGRVSEILKTQGFTNVKKPKAGIKLTAQCPKPGEFMKGVTFGEHNADFVVGLLDGRILAMECKASNSEVNGVKRLNKEVVVDAGDWIKSFGTNVVVASAALRGVFHPAKVEQAQSQQVYIFWWHRMQALETFLADAHP